jgi:hypothetical protein
MKAKKISQNKKSISPSPVPSADSKSKLSARKGKVNGKDPPSILRHLAKLKQKYSVTNI